MQIPEVVSGWPGTFGLLAVTITLAACGGGDGPATAIAAACSSTRGFIPPVAPAPRASSGVALTVEQINVTLSEPVFLTAPPGVTDRAFIVQKGGVIRILDLNTDQLLATPFLTLAVNAVGEGGLLGLAFHPNYATNGFFYVNMINASGDTEIWRYTRSVGDPNVADAGSGQLVISIDQPATTNHKAGWLGFSPNDGYLYAALGDGGGGGDPMLSGQDLGSLLGKMLRLDVDGDDFPGDATRNYAIPADNPCVGQAGARPEIWSMGLRNPWRNAFDRVTGDLYIADVGQGLREEVNVAAASEGGGRGTNYGWNITEGTLCFSPGSGCNMAGLHLPVVEYPHSPAPPGGCSITGGYAYRGSALSIPQGTYFYADFCQGFVRSFRLVGGQVTDHFTWASLGGGNISSFGEDGAGELYILTISGGLRRIIEN